MNTDGERARSANAFDLLRALAAWAVLYSHSFVLVGRPEPQPLAGQTWGSIAVAVFFAISGFLISRSWAADRSMKRFAMRRALRLLPGLVVVVLATALVVGPLVSSWPASEYFLSPRTWSYVVQTALMLDVPPLPGVFEQHPFPFSNNGSLWTLRYEVLMYFVLAAVGTVMRPTWLGGACVGLFCLCAVTWVGWALQDAEPYKLPFVWRLGTEFYLNRIAQLGAFFFAGCVMGLYIDRLPLSLPLSLSLVAACAVVPNGQWLVPFMWFVIPYAAISLAYRAPRALKTTRRFDWSYGIYIYAFPVQQICSSWVSNGHVDWFGYLLLTTLITVACAALSWHFVEGPALSFKHDLQAPRRGDRPLA